MTRTEHLLTILAEECAEVAQRASKALRFGLGEIEPGQFKTNAERIAGEMSDLVAVYHMLLDTGLVPQNVDAHPGITAKQKKVEKFLAYSRECGTLTGA